MVKNPPQQRRRRRGWERAPVRRVGSQVRDTYKASAPSPSKQVIARHDREIEAELTRAEVACEDATPEVIRF